MNEPGAVAPFDDWQDRQADRVEYDEDGCILTEVLTWPPHWPTEDGPA